MVYLDKRLQTLDTADGERFLTAEKKDLLVDAFVKWRIVDPRQYLVAFGGGNAERGARAHGPGRAGGPERRDRQAQRRATSSPASASSWRKPCASASPPNSRQLGVEIVDVRLKRVDFTRPGQQRRVRAHEGRAPARGQRTRSTGQAEAEQIRADAERQRSVILAEAQRDAETIKGEGDAKARQIYAQSFGKNPEFYRFYRSLEAYRADLQEAQRRAGAGFEFRVLQVFPRARRGK